MCLHTSRKVCTEPDGCYWVQCKSCKARGPKRHSIKLAKVSARGNIRIRGSHSRRNVSNERQRRQS